MKHYQKGLDTMHKPIYYHRGGLNLSSLVTLHKGVAVWC